MSALPARIGNPFMLKGALEIVLEVTRIDLANAEIEEIRSLTRSIPNSVRATNLKLKMTEATAILLALRYFAHSRSRYWLREEMANALQEFERLLTRQMAEQGPDSAQGPNSADED